MYNITIFSPHLDDEIIGAGGSIAKHISLGNKVNIVYFNSGKSKKEIIIGEKEAKTVIDFLKVSDYIFLRQTNIQITEEILKIIISFLRKNNTDFIYAPHKNDGDIEHEIVYQIAKRILWLANGDYCPNIKGNCDIKGLYLYEVHKPINYVNYFEDISQYENVKENLIKMYKSRMNIVRYDLSSIYLNKYRGITTEISNCVEAFQIEGLRNIF